jgi:glyoxylase-like metal-dependent hydrolase (beta-lactamase superfamily II)
MKLGENAEALEIPMTFLGNRGTIHPAVLWDERDGISLFDAALPGQSAAIEEKLAVVGLRLRDIRRIFLTHQDFDHIGSAQAIAEATGATVYAHRADVPYIQGDMPLLKLDVRRFEAQLQALPEKQREEIRRQLAAPPKVKVDKVLGGGEELPFHGGIVVVPTPGHTPGHVSYYVPRLNLLIAGDALRVENGSLIGPSPIGTPDMRRAIASLKNLLPWSIETVLCYHGGATRQDAAARLRQLARIKT